MSKKTDDLIDEVDEKLDDKFKKVRDGCNQNSKKTKYDDPAPYEKETHNRL